jgi:hypothetical protein
MRCTETTEWSEIFASFVVYPSHMAAFNGKELPVVICPISDCYFNNFARLITISVSDAATTGDAQSPRSTANSFLARSQNNTILATSCSGDVQAAWSMTQWRRSSTAIAVMDLRLPPAPHAADLEGYGAARVRLSADGGPVVVPPKRATPTAR